MTSRAVQAILAAAVLLSLALAGCGSPEEPPATGSASRTVGQSPTTTPPQPPVTVTHTQTQVHTSVVTHTVAPPSTTTSDAPTTTGSGGGGGGIVDDTPLVNATQVLAVTANSARVAWEVWDDSPSVNSRVEYGIGEGNYSARSLDTAGNGPKSETLLGLRSCTTYAYRVTATDSAGHTGLGLHATPRFTTGGATPVITNVSFLKVMHNSVTIAWIVSGPGDTRTQVEYGPTTAYGSLSETQTGAGVKTAVITGLVQNTDYTFRIRAASPCGDTVSTPVVQRTAVLVHVDIKGNLGATGSFDKGSTVYGTQPVTAGQAYVFEVTNTDSAPHTFGITGGSPYSSGDIPAGQTFLFQTSITFATSGSPYHMRCAYHGAMDGTITVQ